MSIPHDPQFILHQRLLAAMSTVLGDKLPENADPLLGPARDLKFGDFQSNAAMPLGKASGTNPRELAQKLIDALDVGDIAETPDIAGPGFINFRLKPEALTNALEAIDNDSLGIPALDQPSTVVVDLCGVNLAKQMHVGHLRATVIGDALARLHERLGYTVKRQNHFGDWGLPIAMVTRAIHRRLQDGSLDLDRLELEELEQLYRDAQRECAPDRKGLDAVKRYGLGPKAQAELEEQVEGSMIELEAAKKALVALQSGDKE
ncbi:MAG: arginine--tRNA ligase, partial [Planctomycetota bacterium]